MSDISKEEYGKLAEKISPPSPKIKDFIWAFCVGGGICVIGQLLMELFKYLKLSEDVIKMLVPVTIIFIAALLTGLKVFHKIAKKAGAGTLVPITGFANAVVSTAIEFKNEGWVFGVGANMFKIAGPVVVYGVIASVVYGVIYWVTTLF